MKENEELEEMEITKAKLENVESNENEEIEVGMITVNDLSKMRQKSKTKCNIFTNITDKVKLFNLESHVDVLLNDCEGEVIHVKEMLIKRYEKKLKKPEIDEETGEIIKDTEIKMSTILVDNDGKSYVTGSKLFAIQLSKYYDMFGIDENGFTIKIVKNKVKDSSNKSLGFEIIEV